MGPSCPLFQQIPLRSLLPLCFCLLEAAGPCSHCVGRLKGFGGTMRQRCQQPGSAQSPQRGFSRRRAQNKLRHSGRHQCETCSPLPEKCRLPGPSLQSFELRLLDIFLSGMKNPDSQPSSLRPRSVHSPSSPLDPMSILQPSSQTQGGPDPNPPLSGPGYPLTNQLSPLHRSPCTASWVAASSVPGWGPSCWW